MKTEKHYLIRFLLISTVTFSGFLNAADIEAGKGSASQCMGCHGMDGNSKNAQYPKLAGQKSSYLEKQLSNFQSGQRSNSTMQGVAENLKPQDIKNIAAFFASVSSESAGGNTELAKKGEAKAGMCKGCHGAALEGRGIAPKLAGQHPGYLKKQLLNFKAKTRVGGPMGAVASSLSEDDINEIAAYSGRL